MFFEQATELEQGRRIRCGIVRQVEADKSPDRLAIVDCVFDALIRQAKALLGDIHPEHALNADWRMAATFALRGEWGDFAHQHRPRRHRVDLAQKAVAPRHFLVGRVLQFGKTRLHRQVTINFQCSDFRRLAVPSSHRSVNKSARPQIYLFCFSMRGLKGSTRLKQV